MRISIFIITTAPKHLVGVSPAALCQWDTRYAFNAQRCEKTNYREPREYHSILKRIHIGIQFLKHSLAAVIATKLRHNTETHKATTHQRKCKHDPRTRMSEYNASTNKQNAMKRFQHVHNLTMTTGTRCLHPTPPTLFRYIPLPSCTHKDE